MRVSKLLEGVVLVGLLGALGAGALQVRAARSALEGRTAALRLAYNQRARAALPRFLSAASSVEGTFAVSGPQVPASRDAGPFLNGRLPWRSGGVEVPGPPRELALPPQLEQKLNAWGTYWVAQQDDVDVIAANPAWLTQLARSAEAWDLGEGIEGHDALPDFTLLQQWAKVRLLQGAHRRDLDGAALEVDKLAVLCASTETLEGALAGLAMRELEVKLAEATGHKLASDRLARELARPVIWGAVAYAAPFVEPELRAKAAQVAVGRCAALDEATRFPAIERAFGLPGSPLPSDPSCHPAKTRVRHASLPFPAQELARIEAREPLLQGWQGKVRRRLFPRQCAELVQLLAAQPIGFKLLEAMR